MDKKLIFLIVVFVVSIIFLSGCINSEKNKFVGTWELVEYGSYEIEYTMVFFSDGTLTINADGMDYSGTYEIKDGKLVFTSETSGMESYDYSFSSNETELTLRKVGDNIDMIFAKQ